MQIYKLTCSEIHKSKCYFTLELCAGVFGALEEDLNKSNKWAPGNLSNLAPENMLLFTKWNHHTITCLRVSLATWEANVFQLHNSYTIDVLYFCFKCRTVSHDVHTGNFCNWTMFGIHSMLLFKVHFITMFSVKTKLGNGFLVMKVQFTIVNKR